jgi:hypothetical protein
MGCSIDGHLPNFAMKAILMTYLSRVGASSSMDVDMQARGPINELHHKKD